MDIVSRQHERGSDVIDDEGMSPANALGSTIEALRKVHGYSSASRFARKADLSVGKLKLIEKGEAKATKGELTRIGEILAVDLAVLQDLQTDASDISNAKQRMRLLSVQAAISAFVAELLLVVPVQPREQSAFSSRYDRWPERRTARRTKASIG